MQVYLVGGAVRDMLLGLPVHDKDFVVVGADFDEMKSLGFVQVGADFPVFLHPDTHFEYALARIERKNGTGYQGFATETKGVSLADDLLRRDLTINALAMEVNGLFDDTPKTGQVIDFYGGVEDLTHKVLRHVSPAFVEDPLRVLRVARFYARFYELDFVVAPDTACLMQQIANNGELSYLSRERIWAECVKALNEKNGFAFFALLFELGILVDILPELAMAWRSIKTYQNTMSYLKNSHHKALHIKFALLISGLIDKEEELHGVCKRLLIPKLMMQFSSLLALYHYQLLNYHNISAHCLLDLIECTKAQKNKALLFDLLDTVEIMYDKKISHEFFDNAILIYQSITIKDIDNSLKGKQIGDELARIRTLLLEDFLRTYAI